MVSIQYWVAVDPRYVTTDTSLENPVRDILSPIHLHKTIMKNIAGSNGIVLVSQLAKELDVSVELMTPNLAHFVRTPEVM